MSDQPLGVVVSYMGQLATQQELVDDDGSAWLLCDGAPVSRQTYVDLYALIGDTFGTGDGTTTFNLPDFQGLFIRVLDTDMNGKMAGRDPGFPAERTPIIVSTPESYIGSLELDAVPHVHSLSGYSSAAEAGDWEEKHIIMSNDDPSSVFGWTDMQGANETRPKNVFLNFLIRARAVSSMDATSAGLPVGSVLYYTQPGAPQTSDEVWYPCDGTTPTLPRMNSGQDATECELFAAIGTYFGEGDGTTTFGLPDLRGYFLRGVNSSPSQGASGNDPDVGSRTPINANAPKDAVGSYQSAAVANHQHNIWNTWGCYDGDDHAIKCNYANTSPAYSTVATWHNTRAPRPNPLVGSDIRPINAALSTAILGANSVERLPVGAIVSYAGNGDPAPDVSGDVWLICDGRTITNPSTDYANLFYALFGLGPSDPKPPVQVPDLRGRFVRGFDPNGKYDTDVSSRLPMFTPSGFPASGAGASLTSVEADIYGSHSHGLSSAHHCDHDGGSSLQGDSASNDGGDSGGPTDGVTTGLGLETRPLNMYLHHIIRVQ